MRTAVDSTIGSSAQLEFPLLLDRLGRVMGFEALHASGLQDHGRPTLARRAPSSAARRAIDVDAGEIGLHADVRVRGEVQHRHPHRPRLADRALRLKRTVVEAKRGKHDKKIKTYIFTTLRYPVHCPSFMYDFSDRCAREPHRARSGASVHAEWCDEIAQNKAIIWYETKGHLEEYERLVRPIFGRCRRQSDRRDGEPQQEHASQRSEWRGRRVQRAKYRRRTA
ncbi:unnamed protein product [Leptosia nina]|uniref:Uncharacterized protein n=1 Tax=Leptosia nina TaxID=320188 RepID=A0AAV1JL05_9NEOP